MPKYLSVRDQLLDLVESGAAGDALPSERNLALSLAVSRVTIRRALEELEMRGVVERRHGSGTYIAPGKVLLTPLALSFSRRITSGGSQPSARTLDFGARSAGTHLARLLRTGVDDEVLVFQRLRLIDEVPLAIETLHIASALVPGMKAEDLESGSFYELLEHRYGRRVANGRQMVEASLLDAEEAQLLEVTTPAAAFRFERTMFDSDGFPLEYVRSVSRADRLQLQVELADIPVEYE